MYLSTVVANKTSRGDALATPTKAHALMDEDLVVQAMRSVFSVRQAFSEQALNGGRQEVQLRRERSTSAATTEAHSASTRMASL